MFKKLLTIIMVAILAASAYGQPSVGTWYHEVQIVDEMGENVTDITSVSIYNVDTTTASTIYAGRNKTLTMTNPITTSSTNTTLSSGYLYWWGPGNYDFSMTDGSNVHTNSGHRDRTPSEGQIAFPSYLSSISSTTYTDAQSITMGTGADWVINAGTTDDLLTFVPATDGAVFRIGTSGTTVNADFEVYTGTGVGLLINEGTSTFGITGLTTNINANSNYVTNINTGTSNAAVNIGSGTSGAWAVDGTSTGTLNADDSIGITTTGASGDITVDSTAGSVIIDGGEAALDAVVIQSTGGGLDMTAIDDIDVTLTASTATEDMTFTLSGACDASIIITSGGIGADAVSIATTHASGDIKINSGDVLDIDAADDITIDLAGASGEDILVTNTGGSITLSATESATDAINIDATAGGVDIDATGTAGEDIQLTNTGASIGLSASEAVTDAINIDATGVNGGIDMDTTQGPITLTAASTTGGDITISAGDILTITHVDKIIFDGAAAETWEIEGTANAYETTVVFTDPTVDGTVTFPTATSGTLLVPSYAAFTASGNIDATQCWGGVFTNTGATGDIEMEMPSAVAGMEFTFHVTVVCDVDLDPESSDNIITFGFGNGISISSDKVVGSSITLFAIDTTNWIVKSICGVWASGGA